MTQMKKISDEERKALPEDVRGALERAQAWLASKAQGRRSLPRPYLLTYPLEEGEEPLYAVALPVAFHQMEALARAASTLKDPVKIMESVLVETLFWIDGMDEPEAGTDPRKTATEYLRDLAAVPGPLGAARSVIAQRITEIIMAPPEVSAGKL